ncbi:MAG: fibronectin type III domain-containing protein [Ornithinimicrobium sp.]
MSDPVISLQPSMVAVEPGGQVRVEVQIANQSSIVEGYRISVVDDRESRGVDTGPADWVEILPPDGGVGKDGAHVSVYPQQRQSVVLIFSPPPGGAALGGAWAFAVRVASVVDENSSVVIEGDLELGEVLSTQGKLTPVTSKGRWHGLHVVQLTNWGNTARRLRLRGEDPDQALGFLIRPDVVDVPVGGTASARLKVRTRTPRLRGTVARLPFTVLAIEDSGGTGSTGIDVAEPLSGVPAGGRPTMPLGLAQSGDSERVVIDGAFTQRPILTRALVTGLVLLLAALIALVAFAWSRREDTPTHESLGTPPTPVLTAQTTGPETILLRWAPVTLVEGYRIDRLEGDSETVVQKEDLAPELGAYPFEGLDPDQSYCFTITAIRGDKASPASDKACSTTETQGGDATAVPSPSSDPSPTDSEPTASIPDDTGVTAAPDPTATDEPDPPPEDEPDPSPADPTVGEPEPGPDAEGLSPGEWVAQLGIFPVANTGQTGADALVAALAEEGVAARKFLSSDYPTINPPLPQASWIVYLDESYETPAAAMDGCRDVRDSGDAVSFCDVPLQPIGP